MQRGLDHRSFAESKSFHDLRSRCSRQLHRRFSFTRLYARIRAMLEQQPEDRFAALGANRRVQRAFSVSLVNRIRIRPVLQQPFHPAAVAPVELAHDASVAFLGELLRIAISLEKIEAFGVSL